MAKWLQITSMTLSILMATSPCASGQKAGSKSAQGAGHGAAAIPKTAGAWKEKTESGQRLILDGKLGDAEAKLQEALALAEKSGDKKGTIIVLSALAECLEEQKRYGDEEPLRQRALTMAEQVYGANSAEYAEQLAGLASMLATKGEVAQAHTQLDRAQSIADKSPGDTTLAKAGCQIATGRTQESEKSFGLADDSFKAATELRQSKLGDKAILVLLICREHANLLEQLGRKDEANKLRERVRLANVAAAAPVATSAANAAKVPAGKDKFLAFVQEAKAAEEKNDAQTAMTSWKAAVAEAEATKRNDRLAYALVHLGDQFATKQSFEEADALYKRALDLREAAGSTDTLGMSRNLTRVANSYLRKKDGAMGEKMLSRAYECQEKCSATTANMKTSTLQSLLSACLVNKNLARAEQVSKTLITLGANQAGPVGAMKKNMATSMLGAVYMQSGRMNEGMNLMKNVSGTINAQSSQEYGKALQAEYTANEKEIDKSEEATFQK